MQTRCMNCMSLTEQAQGLCPNCGKPLLPFNEPPALSVGAVLQGRYLIGAVYTVNGEGYTYAAFDMHANEAVYIREFFPTGKALRVLDGKNVQVSEKDESICLDWISQFIALHQKLKTMGSTNCISQCRDVFDENGTAYAVIEAKLGKRTLQKYITEYFDVLSWKQAEFLLTPLLYGLSGLNAAGITHCGVCPENLTVDEKGKVRLHHFVIPQARCVGTDMQHELYAGYSAPEQYQPGGVIGEWTDVYAFCAILYRVLTGSMVPKANSRAISDTLTPPKDLNPDVPDSVSKAILLGLNPDPEKRTRSFKTLMHHLYNEQPTEQLPKAMERQAADKTIVIPAVGNKSAVPKKPKLVEDRKNQVAHEKPKMPVALLVLLITLPVVLGLFILVYTMLLGGDDTISSSGNVSFMDGVSYQPSFTEDSSEEEESLPISSSSIENGIEVSNFVGKYFADIENNALYSGLYEITAVYQYDDTVEKGYIIEQSIAKGTIVPKGEAIEFLVSKGNQYFTLPALTDGLGKRKTGEAYAAELSAAGIDSKIETVETNEYAEGKVIELSLPVGGKIDLEAPETVVIFVAKSKEINEEELFGSSEEVSSEESVSQTEESDVETEADPTEE